MAARERRGRGFDEHSTRVRLILASILLNAVILASFLTSSPTVSPASGWITAFDRLVYRLEPVSTKAGLQDLHASASKLSKEQCVACHGSMVGSRLPFHRIHLTSDLLPGLACHECHAKVSLEPRSNEKVVRLVDVGFCKSCHSPFTGLSPTSTMKPIDFKADCTTCHSGKHAFKHKQPFLSHVIAPRECPGCHGGRVLPWQAGHELDTWIKEHGQQAFKVGVDSCMRCHEYGLQFCTDCHKNKPPTHALRDKWLLEHRPQAKTDTRACFTCHKAQDCRRCHINHAAGWRADHAPIVLREGTDLCQKCHSTTFCSSCHIASRSRTLTDGVPRP